MAEMGEKADSMKAAATVTSQGTPGIIAAPAGGPEGGRGCAFIPFLMTALVAGTLSAAEPVTVPSGLEIQFHDWIDDAQAQRFRFVVPGLGQGGPEFADVAGDMTYLCDQFALPQLKIKDMTPMQITVTLMEKPVEFGAMAPDVTQFFESYTVENGLCIWEVF